MPPGQMSEMLGVNGYAQCDCGSDTFHLMVKVEIELETLVVTKCANPMCDKERPVPHDDGSARKFRT